MRRTIAIAALVAATAALPAAAEAATLEGKTKGGSQIKLNVSGNKASNIRTVVPTVCVETTGSGQTRSGVELFQPPGKFKLGKTTKRKKLQPAAMNSGAKATKNYKVKLRRSGGKVKGKLSVNFSFLRPDLFSYLPDTYICSGSSTFTAQ